MKRRTFGLLAGTSLATMTLRPNMAQAARDPSLLTTTLTPFGAERAGNADGSIPAWDGGYNTIPAGWQTGQWMPDPFADEQPVVVIDASNMAQHADRLSDGVMAMMTKYGFSMKVYPTHRTQSCPQEVYDSIAKNVTTAQLVPQGGRLGFTGAYGGIPFPIPDIDKPLDAGAQIIWNNNHAWYCYAYVFRNSGNVVSNGGAAVLTSMVTEHLDFPYYRKGGSVDTYKGYYFRFLASPWSGPPNLVGEEVISIMSSNPVQQPDVSWELLNGQGRVRRAPEISFDTPSSFADGVAYYDEYEGFEGSLEKYDWKYVGKKEMYIPYTNNRLVASEVIPAHKAHFLDPELVRWELHRVWVVEATLHPGERHTIPRKMMYVDEDTWLVKLIDGWDANNNLFHVETVYSLCRPDIPAQIYCSSVTHDMQTGDYVSLNAQWDEKNNPSMRFVDAWPDSLFDPQNMAAAGQY